MTYAQAADYLFHSAPLFQNIGAGAYKEGLHNTLALDTHHHSPHRQYATIHVGGTNGKGSVSHTLAAILQCAGYHTGLFTSPHLTDFRERIRVDGRMILRHRVVEFVENERAFFEPLHPSFFELTTALAFQHFAREKVDVAVVEVGLGGRLDCTNIISPRLSVITNISPDHTQFLGHTLEQIAREKAGIIKEGTPVVIGEAGTDPLVAAVFRTTAQARKAPIRFASEEGLVLSSEPLPGGGRRYSTLRHGTLCGQLGGLCQEKNTATILAAVEELVRAGFSISPAHVARGMEQVCRLTGLRGRWQRLSERPLCICDTGHNAGGMEYIAAQLRALPCRHTHIVLGMAADKDIPSVLALLPRTATYYFTQAGVSRALPAEALAGMGRELGLCGQAFPSVEQAYAQAIKNAAPDDVVFVGGSTFVVADLLASLSV